MPGQQGLITNHRIILYQESPLGLNPSAAIGIDTNDSDLFKILTRAVGDSFDFPQTAQISISSATDGNITFTPNGAGVVSITELSLTTDLAVTHGGTGVSTLTDHGMLIGSGTGAITPLSVGTTGQILTGVSANDPTWTTATYPATVTKGDVLVASANDVIGIVAGATTAGYVLTANGAGTAPTFQAASGGGIGTLAGDSGTATGATVTIAGGTNLTSVAGTSTLTINLDAALTGTSSHVFANAGYLGTGTTAADTLLLNAYNVNGAAYTTFATLTAHATTPTMDLASAVTINSSYIYRASGTDVAVADGGTGASILTQNGVIYGNATSAVGITAEGSTGTILVGTTGNAPSWLATGAEGKVLTSHNGSALTWETPTGGGGGITWSIVTSDLNPMVVDNGYIANKAGLLTFTLPTTCATGKVLRVTGMNTALGWKIAQSANQIIHFGTSTTTTGVGGSLASVNIHDSVELVCIVADLQFLVVTSSGNITIV